MPTCILELNGDKLGDKYQIGHTKCQLVDYNGSVEDLWPVTLEGTLDDLMILHAWLCDGVCNVKQEDGRPGYFTALLIAAIHD